MRIDIAQIRQFFRRVTSTRYVRILETDLARVVAENGLLRDENRALLNSILGIAGIPPVYSTSAEHPRSILSPRTGFDAPAPEPVSPLVTDPSAAGGSQIVPPAKTNKSPAQSAAVRRRSWHQINRALEFQAARKGAQESTRQ